MPVAIIHSNNPTDYLTVSRMFQDMTELLADAFGRPKDAVLISLNSSQMSLGMSEEPVAYLDIRSVTQIGTEEIRTLCVHLGESITQYLQVPQDRIHFQFLAVAPQAAWSFPTDTPRHTDEP
jgi:hypothetical protein